MYPEIDIVEGSGEAFLGTRTGCIIGQGLQRQFGWQVGDRIPLIGGIFEHPGGDGWEFEVCGVYVPRSSSVDNRTMFFNWDYFQKTMEDWDEYEPAMGTVVIRTEPGASQTTIMRDIEAMFENGPQRVQATTEAEFQALFVSMVGNVPFFVTSIGGGVLIAILLASINTMLMSFREQTRDVGVLKALGFSDAGMFALMIWQSLLLCRMGGVLGVGLAIVTKPLLGSLLGTMFPGYTITPGTVGFGMLVALGIGLVSGIVPAVTAGRLRPVEALRAV
jgi:putative ABC transport system permease protein